MFPGPKPGSVTHRIWQVGEGRLFDTPRYPPKKGLTTLQQTYQRGGPGDPPLAGLPGVTKLEPILRPVRPGGRAARHGVQTRGHIKASG